MPTKTTKKTAKKARKKRTPKVKHDPVYDRNLLKQLVRTCYDLQEKRMAHGQRQKALAHRGMPELNESDTGAFAEIFGGFKDVERLIEKQIHKVLKRFPIWTKWLDEVTGVGPMMGGIIVSKFDPYDAPAPEGYGVEHAGAYEGKYLFRECIDKEKDTWNVEERECIMRQRTVSQFWAYSGLHTIEVDDKEGGRKRVAARQVAGKQGNYETWLRAKLLGVLGDIMIKGGSPYKRYYDECKKRRIAMGWGTTDMHRHKDAKRHMMKCFIMDLYVQWRTVLDLPVRAPYALAKMGLSPAQAFHVEEHPGWNRKDAAEAAAAANG
jgi:hypothetical protein